MPFQESSSSEMEGDMRNRVDELHDSDLKFFGGHGFLLLTFLFLTLFFALFFSRCLLRLFLFFRFGLSLSRSLTLSLSFCLNFSFLLSFLPGLVFGDDGFSFGIDFEHILFFVHPLSNLIDGPVDHINEAFERVLVEGVDLREV